MTSPASTAATSAGLPLLSSAAEDSRAAAVRADVTIGIAHGRQELAEVSALLDEVWGQRTGSVLPVGALIALAHSGNYVATARADDGTLVGTAVGFFAPPSDRALHSHIAGVRHDHRGRGVGHALKLHQRLWAIEHQATSITWTFDPLVARNAYLNVHVLGARLERYLVDLYGPMADSLNRGDESDRALVRWDLAKPSGGIPVDDPGAPLLRSVDGHPRFDPAPAEQRGIDTACLRIPTDIEAVRREHPSIAREWREALRSAMSWADDAGWHVADVTRDGAYVLRQDG